MRFNDTNISDIILWKFYVLLLFEETSSDPGIPADLYIYSVTLNANFVIIITPLRSFFTMIKELRSSVIMTTKFALTVTE